MKYTNCLLMIMSVLLMACGGGGGSIDKGDASSSSSSSSSVAVVSNCSNTEGAIFVDEVCSPWRSLSAYEQLNVSPWTGEEITDGDSGRALTFSVIQSSDAQRNKILDITYRLLSDYAGVVRMRAPETTNSVDMSDYVTGKLQFDLKVINEGADKPNLELVIECGYPCGNSPIFIKPDTLNQWQSFEISIADLIDKGLDIKKVGLGFMLSPTWEKQQGVHFQLDNIRWTKGVSVTPTTQTCFANYFDTKWVQGVEGPGVKETYSNNQNYSSTTGVNPYAKITPNWSSMPGNWTVSFSEAISYPTGDFLKPSSLSSCSGSGELLFDMYVSKALVDDATMAFTVHFMDKNNVIYEIPGSVKLVANMTANNWNRVVVTLPSRAPYENLKYVGLSIDSTNVNAGSDAYFYVDNIQIVKPVP